MTALSLYLPTVRARAAAGVLGKGKGGVEVSFSLLFFFFFLWGVLGLSFVFEGVGLVCVRMERGVEERRGAEGNEEWIAR